MLPTTTLFMFFLGVLTFLTSGGASTPTPTNSSRHWQHESSIEDAIKPKTGGSTDSFDKCGKNSISLVNAPILERGIPTYRVMITNNLTNRKCSISNIRINCGSFSSDNVINPKIFKRLGSSGVCIINNGGFLPNGNTISFEYRNTFSYKLSIASVMCKCS